MNAENLKNKGWTWKTAGEVAQRTHITLGRIACPHCGSLTSGALEPKCPICEKPYWQKILQEKFFLYSRKLLQLHQLIAKNQDESPEGDALRGEMFDLYCNLTHIEKELIDCLSGNLYMLSGQDMYAQTTDLEKETLKLFLFEHIKDQDWISALHALEKDMNFSVSFIAYFRALAWSALGLNEIGLLFYTFAENEMFEEQNERKKD
jgi:hypothetical protein